MSLENQDDQYIVLYAMDYKLNEYHINHAQLKRVMIDINEWETEKDGTSAYSSDMRHAGNEDLRSGSGAANIGSQVTRSGNPRSRPASGQSRPVFTESLKHGQVYHQTEDSMSMQDTSMRRASVMEAGYEDI